MTPARNPFSELEKMFERMSRQFEESPWMFERGAPGGDGAISVDLADHGDEFVLTADLPGFEKEDIHVECTDSRVSIRAEHEEELDESDETYVRRERTRRSVRRSLDLPAAIDTEETSATYKNGVLTLTLPRAEPTDDGREIDIE